MQITETIKTIIHSIHWRANTYGQFGLSKYEFEKFWLTERTLRTIINKLQLAWYIERVWQETFIKEVAGKAVKMRRNLYKATTKLFALVKSFAKSIENMNEKIIDWCKNQRPFDLIRSFWLEVTMWGRIGGKKSKITVNKRNWSVTNWKEQKSWNLFWYLREHTGQGVLEFYHNFIA